MKKKVLILGGAGFIGINIAKILYDKKDCNITVADNNYVRDLDYYFDKNAQKEIKFINADFSDLENFEKLEKDYDQVYMLAAIVGVNPTLEHPEKVIKVNTALVYNTIEWLKYTTVKKLLYSSSSECYAGTTEAFNYKIPTPEEVPLCINDISHPRWTYAITKILGESAFLNSLPKMNIDVTIVRYQNAFGPDMGFKHAIPHIIERFFKKENPVKIYGAKDTRAFCYITDSAEGTVLAMENSKANNEIYHIGSMDEISMEELTKEIGKIFKYEGDYIFAPTYPGSVSRRCPDISKAKKHLGYNPKVNWKEGLIEAVKWYKDFFESGETIYSGGFEPPENFQ